jgi:hypothetical protein
MSPIAPSSPSILGSSYLNFTGLKPSSSFTGRAGPKVLSEDEQYKRYFDQMSAKARAQREVEEKFNPMARLERLQNENYVNQRIGAWEKAIAESAKQRERYNSMTPQARMDYDSPASRYRREMELPNRQLAEQKSAENAYQNNKANWGIL